MVPKEPMPMQQFPSNFDAFELEKDFALDSFDPFADSDTFGDSFAGGSFSASNTEEDDNKWGSHCEEPLPSRHSTGCLFIAPSSQDTSTIRGRKNNRSAPKLQTESASSPHARTRSSSRKRISKSTAPRQRDSSAGRISPNTNSEHGHTRKVFPQNLPRTAPPRRSSLGALSTARRERFSDLMAANIITSSSHLSSPQRLDALALEGDMGTNMPSTKPAPRSGAIHTRRNKSPRRGNRRSVEGPLSSGSYHGSATTSNKRVSKQDLLLPGTYHGTGVTANTSTSKASENVSGARTKQESGLSGSYHGAPAGKTKEGVALLAGSYHGTTTSTSGSSKPKENVSAKKTRAARTRKSLSPVPPRRSPPAINALMNVPTARDSPNQHKPHRKTNNNEVEFKYSPIPKKQAEGDNLSSKSQKSNRSPRKEQEIEFRYSPSKKKAGEDESLASSRHSARRHRPSVQRSRLGHDLLVRNMDLMAASTTTANTTTNNNNAMPKLWKEPEEYRGKDEKETAVWQNRRRRHQEQSYLVTD